MHNIKLYALMTLTFVLVLLFSFQAEESLSKEGPRTIVLEAATTVSLNLPIDGESASDIQSKLIAKSASNPRAELYLTLNSPGGSIYDGEKIIETASGLPNKIHTISLFSASMSFIISQNLDRRYVLESGTMMSHRAFAGGLEGNIPGNLITRTLALLQSLVEVDAHIAHRAGYTTEAYQAMIADELWMRGNQAVKYKFADEVVRIRCGHTLQGPAEPVKVNTFFGPLMVIWSKCPLITQPIGVSGADRFTSEAAEEVITMLSDRSGYIHKYGFKHLNGVGK